MTARASKLSFGIAALLVLTALFLTRSARADEQLIIKQPGDHPTYGVEIEPHFLFAALLPAAGSDGFGLGGRFSIPIVKNGFVPSINNSVAIGLGVDWIHYNGCLRGYYFSDYCSDLNTFVFPVVMQWNFFLSTHWSVFGEPGFNIYTRSYSGTCAGRDLAGNRYVADCPGNLGVDFAFFVGGRYHFSETVALTMRVGYPYFSVGASFMP